jgi:hypothetical protein
MTSRLEEFHLAIADRSFGNAGPGARPARVIHDSVACLRRAGGATARAGGAAAARRSLPGAPSLGDSPRGAFALAALNGILGSDLEADESALALEMALRHGDRDVSVAELAELLPETTPKITVFVHGLCESEHSWGLFREANGGETYASRLREDLGYTPLHVRLPPGVRPRRSLGGPRAPRVLPRHSPHGSARGEGREQRRLGPGQARRNPPDRPHP